MYEMITGILFGGFIYFVFKLFIRFFLNYKDDKEILERIEKIENDDVVDAIRYGLYQKPEIEEKWLSSGSVIYENLYKQTITPNEARNLLGLDDTLEDSYRILNNLNETEYKVVKTQTGDFIYCDYCNGKNHKNQLKCIGCGANLR